MGKKGFLSFCDDRKHGGNTSAKQNVRAVGLRFRERADGQTNQIVTGDCPVNPSPPPTIRLRDRSEGSYEVDVCRRMLSVFRFTLAPWVSRHIRMLDGPALRAGKDFSLCRPSVFRTVYNSRLCGIFREWAGVLLPPCPVMIGLPAFKVFDSVGILLPLRLLACWPGRRQTANHVGI